MHTRLIAAAALAMITVLTACADSSRSSIRVGAGPSVVTATSSGSAVYRAVADYVVVDPLQDEVLPFPDGVDDVVAATLLVAGRTAAAALAAIGVRDGDTERMRRDAEQNRQKILAAADRLISEKGLGVGHDQIARAAGVAVGTVYRRFPDKSALVAALFTEQVEVVVGAARAALVVEDPWQAIVDFLTAILKMQADSRGLRELVSGSPHGQDLTRSARTQIGPVVSELVARGHDAGVLRTDIAEQDIALIPIMVGSIIQAARTVDPDLWRRTLAVVLDGLRAGHSEPLPGSAPTAEQLTQIIAS